MKHVIQLGAAAGLALLMVACSGDGRTDGTVGTGAAQTDRAVGTAGERGAGATDADRSFVQQQLADGEKEVQLGELAQQKATSPAVKEFGQMMVRDHRAAGSKLREVAARAHVDLHADESKADSAQDAQETLSKAKGRDFDREYVDMMVDDHEKAVDDVKDRAENAGDENVKRWAADTLPKLQSHLEHARQLQDTLKDQGGSKGPKSSRDR